MLFTELSLLFEKLVCGKLDLGSVELDLPPAQNEFWFVDSGRCLWTLRFDPLRVAVIVTVVLIVSDRQCQ